jgi:hypothetical protein
MTFLTVRGLILSGVIYKKMLLFQVAFSKYMKLNKIVRIFPGYLGSFFSSASFIFTGYFFFKSAIHFSSRKTW